jgi:hypothetical protein
MSPGLARRRAIFYVTVARVPCHYGKHGPGLERKTNRAPALRDASTLAGLHLETRCESRTGAADGNRSSGIRAAAGKCDSGTRIY